MEEKEMSNNDMILSMNGDTFEDLKNDMDTIINRTIGNMEMKGAEDATITVKISVNIEKANVPCATGAKEIVRPTFRHDISSVMQVKDKVSGQLCGDYELMYDIETGTYYMRHVDDGQIDLFDDTTPKAYNVEPPQGLPQGRGELLNGLDEEEREDGDSTEREDADEPESGSDDYEYDEPEDGEDDEE
jgi:hypothetical protein